jgi:hypothetical protein
MLSSTLFTRKARLASRGAADLVRGELRRPGARLKLVEHPKSGAPKVVQKVAEVDSRQREEMRRARAEEDPLRPAGAAATRPVLEVLALLEAHRAAAEQERHLGPRTHRAAVVCSLEVMPIGAPLGPRCWCWSHWAASCAESPTLREVGYGWALLLTVGRALTGVGSSA